jgi:hypothetical protein
MKKLEIDMERLALAIADHEKTVAEVVAHKSELANLQEQIKELDYEINDLGIKIRSFDVNNSVSIKDIKALAQQKLKTQYEIEALTKVRDELKKKYPSLERDYGYLDVVSVSDSKRFCWSILYDGLLKSIDTEPLKQLIAVGVANGRDERMVMSDLNLTVEYERLSALAKQFNLPM